MDDLKHQKGQIKRDNTVCPLARIKRETAAILFHFGNMEHNKQLFEFIIVIDFEATCDQAQNPKVINIIQTKIGINLY